MKKVKLYSWTFCPFCVRAKEVLVQNGIEFEEIVIENDQAEMQRLTKITGSDTVPQIFVEDEFIGGCDELLQIEREGKVEDIFR
ncbi:glutaredoxin 3 [Tindallia californiensis]|uniref:Glutaredoxin n=1 Tax=Tindallia californiensis TaxID=159292 RepID=A0A1H3IPX7_9FIRM|nr:glutaredoxin 3 [Tindallia californiensis]SDY29148.1 glutaredoxin 3 [Tindallia californiensis]